VKLFSGDPFKGRLLSLPANIILGWNCMRGANTTAYHQHS
jgi:hypothetical protein